MPSEQTFFLILAIVISLLAFGFAAWLYSWVKRQPVTNDRIKEIGGLIRKGANTFLTKEYIVLSKFVGIVALLIFVFLPLPIWKNGFL